MGFTGYTMIGLAIVIAGLLAWTQYQSSKLETAAATILAKDTTIAAYKNQYAAVVKANKTKDETIKLIQDQYKLLDGLVTKYADADRKRDASLRAAIKDINDAPDSDDAPVAPVLRRQLERMRANSGSPASNPDGNPTTSVPNS